MEKKKAQKKLKKKREKGGVKVFEFNEEKQNITKIKIKGKFVLK